MYSVGAILCITIRKEGNMMKLIGYATVIGLGLYFGIIQLALAMVGALLVWAGSMLMVFGA